MLLTFTVTKTTDDGSTGTLRWAVEQADSDASANLINFDPTVFSTPQMITLTGGTLELSDTTGLQTVTGPSSGVTISGDNASVVFQVDASVHASISGLTITGGAGHYGGGLQNNGTLALTDCTISGNSSNLLGGGLYNNKYATATLTDCTVSGNSASSEGGGIRNYGTMTLTDSTVGGNSAGSQGAGIEDFGTMTVTNSTVSGNSASQKGGGIFVQNGGSTTATLQLTGTIVSGNSAGAGAGLYDLAVDNITLTNCTFTANTVSTSGGGLFNHLGTATLTDCTFSGNSSAGGSRFSGGGALYIDGTSTLTDCTFSGNSSASDGGGLFNINSGVTLTNCTINGNSAASYDGGGFFNLGGTATLTNCTLSGNSCGSQGGGLNNTYGTTMLTDCTLSGNSTVEDGGGLLNNTGTATLTDCTLSGNMAGRFGGGLEGGYSTTTLTDCTVSGNTAGNAGGGILNFNGGHPSYTVTVGNTIVAGNTATYYGPDAYGAITSKGSNLIGKTDGSTGWVGSDLTGTVATPRNAMLAPLGQHGGPTETIPLYLGSPAIGAGVTVAGVTTDQRGVARPATSPDIGAFQGIAVAVTNTSDLGAGSLRQAIDDTNAAVGSSVVLFRIGGVGSQQTIIPASALPAITSPVQIDGWNQGGAGYDETPLIQIQGNGTSGLTGLDLESNGNTIDGIAIGGYTGGVAIVVNGTGNVIEGTYVGVDMAGSAVIAPAESQGIYVEAADNTIGGTTAAARDVISGSTVEGVVLSLGADDNLVEGDYIGTDSTGLVALGNQTGVSVGGGATGNTIGGVTSTPGTGPGNVISGDTDFGVALGPVASADNVVEGNIIGANASNTAALGALEGVTIYGSSGNTIGGLTTTPGTGAGNDIWGNTTYDVYIVTTGPTNDNVVEGNLIGRNLAGTAPTSVASSFGVAVDGGANNTIGGSISGAGNIVTDHSLEVSLAGGSHNVVQGNQIGGTTAATAAGGSDVGISIHGGTATTTGHNLIGGSTSAQANVISGIKGTGIFLNAAHLDLITGNRIGTAADGSTDLANGGIGISAKAGPATRSAGRPSGTATSSPGTGRGASG